MKNNQNQPREFDAVLGGDNPIITDVVLGGIKGVNRRLSSTNIESQIAALQEAFNYGDKGLDLVISALEHESVKVQRFAAKLLQNLGHKKAKLALEKYKFWHKFEKYYQIPSNYATTFANRKVIEFDPNIGISDTLDIAYALRDSVGNYAENLDKFQKLLQHPLANQIEALVLGNCYTKLFDIVDLLLDARDSLKNIKALFIGDVNHCKLYLGENLHPDFSYILLAYPQLDTLKIRSRNIYINSTDLFTVNFSSVRHENLKTIIIEASLPIGFIHDFCKLELPALEYLELWHTDTSSSIWLLDRLIDNIFDEYERSFFIQNSLQSLLVNLLKVSFPTLKYLGIRGHGYYSNELALAIVNSSIVENLVELDLSVGNINDIVVEDLLNCHRLHQLDVFDISYNSINYAMREKIKQLCPNFICYDDKPADYRYYPANE
jgi:hypothetical protein